MVIGKLRIMAEFLLNSFFFFFYVFTEYGISPLGEYWLNFDGIKLICYGFHANLINGNLINIFQRIL